MTRHVQRVREEVLGRLDRVTDPELDRSVVDLGYIESVEPGATVVVEFVLPTAWCSPAFAWMMASDIREQALQVTGVDTVRVRLREHMHGAEITHGVNNGLGFEEVFADATSGVEAARAKLDGKARLARQYAAVEALLDAGVRPAQVCDLTLADLRFRPGEEWVGVRLDGVVVCAAAEPIERYVEKARDTGVVTGPASRVFATPDGDPIRPEAFELVHRRCRLARVNMRGQGAVCEALHEARHREPRAGTVTGD